MARASLLIITALALVSQSLAQSCSTNGQYACDPSNSNQYTICNNNQLVFLSCGAGAVCCMINSDVKCMPSCPGSSTTTSSTHSTSSSTHSTSSTTHSTTHSSTSSSSPSPTSGYTVTNAQGTIYGTALDNNACGISGADPAVAVNPTWFGNGNPNNAAICGKTIAITNSAGKTINARVVDKCGACQADNHLDMTSGLFYGLGGTDTTGHVYNIDYTIEGWTLGQASIKSEIVKNITSITKGKGKGRGKGRGKGKGKGKGSIL